VKFDVSIGKKEIGPNLSTPDKKLRELLEASKI
jgi:hypothetical protein